MSSGAATIRGSKTASAPTLWQRLRKWSVPALGIIVAGLLVSHANKVDWAGGWEALKRYPPTLLLAVFGLALASHALYGCYDLIGRRHTKHKLPLWRTWLIAITSYAFNLNLGSLVGGIALRARLYARAGLDEATVAQVVGISLATNWLGYALLAGGLFAAGVIAPPKEAHMTGQTLHVVGFVLVGLAIAYVVACKMAEGKEWKFRRKRLHLPSASLAVAQLAISSANWALMGWVMHLLLGDRVDYGTALGVLMAASIVGVMTPIPAGLGVLEAVYLSMLAGSMKQGSILGAVLAYRMAYYLLPLLIGLVLYAALERYASAHDKAS
jgi:uncharacterized membrane protein YbhN (UPF0104 family)